MASSTEGNVGRGRQRTTRPIDRSLKRTRAFRDDGRIATLLKGLPRNYDGLSLTAIVDAIEATITLYHQHTNPSLERHRELASDAINARLSEIHDASAKLADALLAIDGDLQLVLRDRSGGKCPDLADLLGLLVA